MDKVERRLLAIALTLVAVALVAVNVIDFLHLGYVVSGLLKVPVLVGFFWGVHRNSRKWKAHRNRVQSLNREKMSS